MKKHLKLKISGRVQGVSFRVSAKELSEKLGLTGWIENLPEGTVMIEVEGEQDQLERLIDWCRTGPPAARVFMIEFEFFSDLKNYREFIIRW